MSSKLRRYSTLYLSLVLLITSLPCWEVSGQIPADDVLKEFKVNGDFLLVADGNKVESARIFFSEKAVAYLILDQSLTSPLLVQLRARTVESLDESKIIEEDDGTRAILADAELVPSGSFSLKKQEVLFSIGDKKLSLKPRPWLLGKHKGSRLKAHNPEYAFKASQYVPKPEEIALLKGETRAVKIRVYFGSWCPHCKEMVPRVLRVADELSDSKIEFEYFGLFSPLGQDAQARTERIHRVPTAVIYIDGEELLRVDGRDLVAPERSLTGILGLRETTGSKEDSGS